MVLCHAQKGPNPISPVFDNVFPELSCEGQLTTADTVTGSHHCFRS